MNKNRKFRKPKREHKLNREIKSHEVRVVGSGDNINGIYKTYEALSLAKELEKDLVEISPKGKPPVCKIIEYSKFLYNKKKKDKERKKSQQTSSLKEVRFTPNIGEHDLNTKLNNIKKFLSKKDKVKASVFFKGRHIIYKEQGELLLLKILQEIEDIGIPEYFPKLEGKRMHVIIRPK